MSVMTPAHDAVGAGSALQTARLRGHWLAVAVMEASVRGDGGGQRTPEL